MLARLNGVCDALSLLRRRARTLVLAVNTLAANQGFAELGAAFATTEFCYRRDAAARAGTDEMSRDHRTALLCSGLFMC